MLYIILIVSLLIPIALVVGLFYAYKKLPRPCFLFLLFAFIATPFAVFKIYERNFKLSVVPDALKVNSISYNKEESWGFGPGGNEAGIRVYPLAQKVADEISQRGIEFFDNLPPNKNQASRNWRGRYGKWFQTPINSGYWKPDETTGKPNIYNYICAYGFCIDIDDKIVDLATEIISSEGSYYAYGRIGIIVVSPDKKLVLYMYNG
jgi:hypothetical protein